MGHKHLTAAQELFCQEYWKSKNATRAYRQSYRTTKAKPETVHRRAAELLRNGKVTARIAELEAQARNDFRGVAERIVSELSAIAFANVSDLLDHQGRMIPLAELSSETSAAISSLTVRSTRCGADGTQDQVVGIRFVDKVKALALLAQIVDAAAIAKPAADSFESWTDDELDDQIRLLEAGNVRK